MLFRSQGLTTPPDGVHIRATDTPMLQEERLRHVKLPRAIAFARTNGIDRMVLDSADARFGIVVRGKAFTVFRQALAEAGISEDFARAQGLRIWKVGLAWPLDTEAARAFAEGLDEILVIEDRRSFVEWQLRVARGEKLPLGQDEVKFAGHAIEVRLYAEDAYGGFLPQTGRVDVWRPASGPGVRIDHGVKIGRAHV